MRTQSDMERIIKVAETLLDTDMKVEYSSSNSYKIFHPLFDSQFITIPESFDTQSFNVDTFQIPGGENNWRFINILQSDEALRMGKEITKQLLYEHKDPAGLILMITKGYRFQFLKIILHLLSEKDFAEIIRITWSDFYITNGASVFTKKELTDLFSQCAPEYLMSEEELEALRNFPDELTIYRGVNRFGKKDMRTFSWTLSKEAAERVASRYETDISTVYQANINKKDVFAYFAGAEEDILVNPSKLKNITAL